MFTGRKEHSIDAKGRVSVPDRFRAALRGRGFEDLILTFTPKSPRVSLTAWPRDRWEAFLERIDQIPMSSDIREMLDDVVVSSMEICPIDKTGRILIPQTHRAYAGLDNGSGKVLFLGRRQVFEIWDPTRHAALIEKHRQRTDLIKDLAGYGL